MNPHFQRTQYLLSEELIRRSNFRRACRWCIAAAILGTLAGYALLALLNRGKL